MATYLHHAGPTTLPEQPPATDRGEVILCLHGSGGNGAQFDGVMAPLAEHHSPLAFDQPGHGRSGGIDSLGSVGRMADFTRALVHKLGIGPLVLLGHSLGGAVAVRCALDEPALVRGLVLCSTAARFPAADEIVEQTRLVVAGRARRQFPRDAYSPSASRETLGRGFMEDLKTDPRVLLGDLEAGREWDCEAELASIEVPTLVAVGADESAPFRDGAERLAAGIPGATLEVVPDAGHFVPIEQPDALAALAAKLCGGLSS